jgi:uncharacterized protein
VKASPSEQKELLRLQALDIRLQQVGHQTTTLTEHAELTSLGVSGHQSRMTLTTLGGDVEDVRLELSRIESDVAVVEKRIARDADRLQTTSSVKDVQALETELAALRKRLLALEEIEIAVMERLEEREAAVAAAEAERDRIAARVAETEASRDTHLAGLNRQLEELRRDRDVIAGSIAPELATLYERLFVTGHGSAAALLRARTCSGCTITLTGGDLETVRSSAADEVLFCPDCGAILVRTEESGV